MRLRIAPEFAKILDDYCVTLNDYLRKHLKKQTASSPRVQKTVCQQLTNLDQQRAKLGATNVQKQGT